MLETIKLEVPNNPIMLRAVAAALTEMATGNGMVKPESDMIEETFKVKIQVPANAGTIATPPPPPGYSDNSAEETTPPAGNIPPPPPPPGPATTTPAAVAPATTPATPAAVAPAATTAELDAEGLPWDARIDAASKKKLQRGGTWKLKRNVDAEYVEQIKAELRAAIAAGTPPAGTPPPVNPPPPPPANDPPPVTSPADVKLTWPNMMDKVLELTLANKLMQADILNQRVAQNFDVNGFSEMSTTPDRWDELYAFLDAWLLEA